MFSTAVISDGVAVTSNFFVQLSHPLLLQSMFPYKMYKVITLSRLFKVDMNIVRYKSVKRILDKKIEKIISIQ